MSKPAGWCRKRIRVHCVMRYRYSRAILNCAIIWRKPVSNVYMRNFHSMPASITPVPSPTAKASGVTHRPTTEVKSLMAL